MLDSGTTGPENVKAVTRASVTAIVLTGVMRFVLFLAILGVIAGGIVLNVDDNPAAEAFQAAAGDFGMRAFGAVLFAAALSSVIGASYTSATFIIPKKDKLRKAQNIVTIIFVVASATTFAFLGSAPAALLVFAGAFNGLVLPVGFTMIIYVAIFRQKDLLFGYQYPRWLIVLGMIGVIIAWFLAIRSFSGVWDFVF